MLFFLSLYPSLITCFLRYYIDHHSPNHWSLSPITSLITLEIFQLVPCCFSHPSPHHSSQCSSDLPPLIPLSLSSWSPVSFCTFSLASGSPTGQLCLSWSLQQKQSRAGGKACVWVLICGNYFVCIHWFCCLWHSGQDSISSKLRVGGGILWSLYYELIGKLLLFCIISKTTIVILKNWCQFRIFQYIYMTLILLPKGLILILSFITIPHTTTHYQNTKH